MSFPHLRDNGCSGGGVVSPGWGKDTLALVVTSQAADTALNQDKTELAVLILAVPLQMIANGDGLLDQVVNVFGEGGSKTLGLQDTQNLVSGDESHLGNSVGIPEDDTNL